MHIYVVRHGQSQLNAHKIVAGQQESPLTLFGKEQAHLAGRTATALAIDLIVSSPMERARETAEIIATSINYPLDKIEIIPELRERNLGELEGKSYAINMRRNGNYRLTESIAGVEPIELLHQRVNHVLHNLLQRKRKNILIVCHMNIGRMLRTIVQSKPPLGMYDTPRLDNAKIYKLF